MKLVYVTPGTEAELEPYVPWLISLMETWPHSSRPKQENLKLVIDGFLGELTIPYLDDGAQSLPLGCFIVVLNKRSAEIHGITRPDLKELIGRLAGPAIAAVGKKMLEVIFLEHERGLVFAKVPDDAVGAKGFLRRWGFKPMADANTGTKLDRGRRVYVLRREQFIKRYVGAC